MYKDKTVNFDLRGTGFYRVVLSIKEKEGSAFFPGYIEELVL
jgi:hypothetical protein